MVTPDVFKLSQSVVVLYVLFNPNLSPHPHFLTNIPLFHNMYRKTNQNMFRKFALVAALAALFSGADATKNHTSTHIKTDGHKGRYYISYWKKIIPCSSFHL